MPSECVKVCGVCAPVCWHECVCFQVNNTINFQTNGPILPQKKQFVDCQINVRGLPAIQLDASQSEDLSQTVIHLPARWFVYSYFIHRCYSTIALFSHRWSIMSRKCHYRLACKLSTTLSLQEESSKFTQESKIVRRYAFLR